MRPCPGFILPFLLSLVWTSPLMAQEVDSAFAPPEPEANGREWVRMSSGEWLMGDLKNLRDDDFVFDSEDLDELALDWDDVVELRSPRVLTYVFVGKVVISGTGVVRGDQVLVDDGSTQHTMNRSDLIGIIEGKPTELNYWSAKLGFGFIGRSGNTEQVDFNTYLRAKREAALNRLTLDYEGNYGKLNGEESVNNQRATGILGWFVYKNFFVSAPVVEYFSDRFQNIDRRWTGAGAIGVFLIRNDDLEWSTSLGAGYQYSRFESVESDTDPEEETGTIIPSTHLEWDLTGAVELEFEYRAQVGVPETSNAFHHAYALLSIELWNDDLMLESSLTWDRVESPRHREDGTVPERDDFRNYVGFALEF